MSGEAKKSGMAARLPALICLALCAVLVFAILELAFASRDPKTSPRADGPIEGADETIVPGARYRARIPTAGQTVRYGFRPRYGGYYLIRSETGNDGLTPRVVLRKAGESEVLARDDGSGEEAGFRLRMYLDDGTAYCYEVSLPEDQAGEFTVIFEHVN